MSKGNQNAVSTAITNKVANATVTSDTTSGAVVSVVSGHFVLFMADLIEQWSPARIAHVAQIIHSDLSAGRTPVLAPGIIAK
jgi:hypothetical protein